MIENNSESAIGALGSSDQRIIILIPSVILVLGLVISISSAFWSREGNLKEGQLLFERRADRLVTEIQRRIDLPASGLRSIRGLYLSSDQVTGAEFQDFLGSRNLAVEFPGAMAFGYLDCVKSNHLEDYIAEVRADDAPEFDVHPKSGEEELFVVRNLYPMEGNEAAWGFDIGSESRRRATIERAIGTGQPTMSPRIDLVQDERKLASFLYMLPIYVPGSDPQTPEARQQSLMGLASVAISLEHAFTGLARYTDDMLKFDVIDGREGGSLENLFIFETHQSDITGLKVSGKPHRSLYNVVREVVVGGRIWTIHIASLKPFDATVDNTAPALLGVGGSLLTMMFAAVVWALGSSRARALDLAKTMTQDLAEAKARADAANKSKSEFLANMSHEIRTPLTAILGYAMILRDEGNLKKAPLERMEAVNTIVRGGEHLLQIINDILDLSKIEAGKMEVEAIETPLRQLLTDIEGLMSQRAKNKNIALHTSVGKEVPDRIISDPTRLRQILMNLIGNAVKFTDAGAISVTVSTEVLHDQSMIRFEIEDTGPGMEEDQAGWLFNPFTQADGSVTRKHGGTGLGLTISRRLAQSMGGEVRLERTVAGVGSVFVFEVPLVAATRAVSIHEAPTDLSNTLEGRDEGESEELQFTGPILLAEDNLVNQKLIQYHLQKAGGTIELAINGVEALEKIYAAEKAGTGYKLLLTDMQMPKMDGYSLARELRRLGSRMPIIALTAHAMAEDRQKCMDAGCNDYVTKPIDKVELIRACNRLCQRSRWP